MKQPNAHVFSYCPRCGCQTLAPDGRKAFSCANCRFKFYLNCAAAGMALITTPDRRIIVTRRKNDPAKGMLDFPGGFAHPGETIETCLKREIKEELRLDITSLEYLFSLPNTYRFADVTYDITDFVFRCRVENPNTAQPQDDVEAVYFMDAGALNKDQFGLDSAKAVVDRLCSGDIRP